MTQEDQEELTRQAMERAKSSHKPKPAEVKEVEPKEVKKVEPKEVKEVEPSKKALEENQRKLGDRIVTLKPWAGRTKKKFKKEFEYAESMEDIDLQKIVEILVYDQIEEDYQLTEMELQYLLAELKMMSIGPKIECETPCPSCNEVNTIQTTVPVASDYTPDTFPFSYKKWKFKNIKRTEFITAKNTIMTSEDFDGLSTEMDIELACKITKDNKSPKEMLELIDDTPIKELTDVMDEFIKHSATYKIQANKICKNCKAKVTFDIDIISGIFETMAK